MKNLLFLILRIAVLLVLSSPAWCHGTTGYTETADGIRVKAEYDDGEPMSYAEIEITSPDSDIPFQKGRTDRNGVFMFAPDGPGIWQMAISDGMGHRLSLEREITALKGKQMDSNGSSQKKSTPVSRKEGVMTGLAVIFGLSGVIYGWKVRRSASRK